jgi:cytochrome c biogenesis protein CcmG/thiol:disulfide interchange protein DsbE
MKRKIIYYLPFILVFVVLIFFYFSLTNDTSKLSSPIVGKNVPEFNLPNLFQDKSNFKSSDLYSENPIIVNVFSSWCVPCRAEHDILMLLSNLEKVEIYGINYKDKIEAGLDFISELGNPYTKIGTDQDGRVAIEWGVYGIPESFIIKNGKVIYKHIGPIHMTELDEVILPILKDL